MCGCGDRRVQPCDKVDEHEGLVGDDDEEIFVGLEVVFEDSGLDYFEREDAFGNALGDDLEFGDKHHGVGIWVVRKGVSFEILL